MSLHCPVCQAELPVTDVDLPAELSCSRCGKRLKRVDGDTVVFRASTAHTSPDDGEPREWQTTARPVRLGDYELIREIARGAMGVVYQARQISLDRQVALKMIRSAELADAEEIRRFRGEAEAAARLDHPQIVPVYEVGEENQQHYFSMGLVDGPTLREYALNRTLSDREAGQLVRLLCAGVSYAHHRGIIHRDLKPSNVLIDGNGQPRITDFGLAKRLESTDGMTATGQIVGTPSYMAPEQAAGRTGEISAAADIYALGGILYFLLTGRPPFQSGHPVDTLHQVQTREPVSPRLLNPNIDRDLETICLKCLEKPATARYGSADELAAELDRYLQGVPIHARPISRIARGYRWCRRNPAVSISLVTVFLTLSIATVVSALFARRAMISDGDSAHKAEQLSEQLVIIEKEQGRTQQANAKVRTQLNRAQSLLAASYVDEAFDGYSAGRTTSTLLKLAEALNELPESNPALAQRIRAQLLSISMEVPQVRQMLPHRGASCFAFSPDGQRVATAGIDDKVHVWDLSSGKRLQSFEFKIPDQQRAFPSRSVPEPDPAFKLVHARKQLHAVDLRYDSTGEYLVLLVADGSLCVWRTATGAAVESPCGEASDEHFVRSFQVLPDQPQLLIETGDSRLQIMDLRLQRLIGSGLSLKEGRRKWMFELSPNGRHVAVWDSSILERNEQVLIRDLRSGDVVFGPYPIPQWSGPVKFAAPDGPRPSRETGDQRLVVFGQKENVVLAARTGQVLERTEPVIVDWEFSYNIISRPDRRQFVSDKGKFVEYLTELRSQATRSWDPEPIWSVRNSLWQYSPDNQTVAVVFREPRGMAPDWFSLEFLNCRTARPIGRPLVLATAVDSDIRFSPDGKLVVVGGVAAEPLVISVPQRHPVTRKLDISQVRLLRIHPDNRRLLTVSPRGFDLWDLESGDRLPIELPHVGTPTMAGFDSTGDWLVTADSQGHIKLWSTDSWKCRHDYQCRSGQSNDVRFAGRGAAVAIADGDEVILWSIRADGVTESRARHSRPIRRLDWLADSRLLAAIGSAGKTQSSATFGSAGYPTLRDETDLDKQGHVSVFSVDGGLNSEPVLQTSGVAWIAASADGESIVTTDRFFQYSVWHRGPAGYQRFGDRFTAYRSSSNANGRISFSFSTFAGGHPAIFAGGGQTLVVSGMRSVEAYDARTLKSITGPVSLANTPAASVSPDGKTLVFIGTTPEDPVKPEGALAPFFGRSLQVWDLSSQQRIAVPPLLSPTGMADTDSYRVFFSPDGARLFVMGAGSRVQIFRQGNWLEWDTALLEGQSPVFLSPGNRGELLSVDRLCRAQLTDTTTGTTLGASVRCNFEGDDLNENADKIRGKSATLTGDGRFALVLDRSEQLWVIRRPDPLSLEPAGVTRWIQRMVGHRLTDSREIERVPAAEWVELGSVDDAGGAPSFDELTWRTGEFNDALSQHDWDRAEFHINWIRAQIPKARQLARQFRTQVARELMMVLFAPPADYRIVESGSSRPRIPPAELCRRSLRIALDEELDSWRVVTIQSALADALIRQAKRQPGDSDQDPRDSLCEAECLLRDALERWNQDRAGWPDYAPVDSQKLTDQLQVLDQMLQMLDDLEP